MNAREIATRAVLSVSPETTVYEAARLLFENRISGVPVVSGGKLVGILTEGDLIRRAEIGTDARRLSWWDRMFHSESPAEFVKTHAMKVGDVMTRNVVSVTEDTPVSEIADIFETRRIKRVPVLRGDELVGIVSRADLIKAIARTEATVPAPDARSDSAIREILIKTLEARPWWAKNRTAIEVRDGVVHFRGLAGENDDRDAVRVAAELIPGVRAVKDHRFRMPIAEG